MAIETTMGFPGADSLLILPHPAAAEARAANEASSIECDVIELFDQFYAPMFRYVLCFGISVHDGEDIVQEVFLSLFRHLGAGKSRRNLRGWIFRVAHNLALKKRHANRRNENPLSQVSDEKIFDPPDPAPNPEQQLASARRQRHLAAVVQSLPLKDQCCIHLRAEGLRYREIAEILGMSLGGVSISLARSLKRIASEDRRHS